MLVVYLLTRLFNRSKEILIWGDEARYLATAKNFYKLWNKSFYDTHPPLYPLLIKQVSKIMADYKSGIVVSLLSSIGLYYICLNLYQHLGLTHYQMLIALGFISFNYTLIYYSNRIFRYQLLAMLGTGTLFFLIINHPVLAGLTWGLTSLTCCFAGLRLFWIWFFWFLSGNSDSYNLIPVIIYLIFYISWLLVKLWVYSKHKYYPSGLDGKIEPVDKITWRQLVSPMYFPFTYEYYGKKELGYDFKGWFRKIRGMFGLYQVKNKKLNTILVFISISLVVICIKGMFQSRWYLSAITIALLYPSLYKRFLPRNSIITIPLIGYFLAKGMPIVNSTALSWAILGVLGGFLWLNREMGFPKPKWQGRAVSAYLDTLPKEGILCEGLIAYSMAYLTNKRIVVIPHTPDPNKAKEQVDLSIKEFDLHYIVYSDLWRTEEHLGYPAIEYIKTFPLINTIQEEGDIYYVHKVSVNFPTEKKYKDVL